MKGRLGAREVKELGEEEGERGSGEEGKRSPGFNRQFYSSFDPFWFQVRERLELLRQQAAAAALEVPKTYLLH